MKKKKEKVILNRLYFATQQHIIFVFFKHNFMFCHWEEY